MDFLETYCVEHRQQLYRLAYSYVRNQEDALDVVGDAVLKALNSRRKLRNPDGVKTWMYRIVVNTALDLLRTRQKSIPEEEMPEEPVTDQYQDLDLHAALDLLPPQLRIVVVLRFFEDMKLEEVAQVLDENVSTVKTRLYTALKRLRIQLEEDQA